MRNSMEKVGHVWKKIWAKFKNWDNLSSGWVNTCETWPIVCDGWWFCSRGKDVMPQCKTSHRGFNEVSINVGTPKWMIYNGKSNENWWFGVTHGYTHFRKTPYRVYGVLQSKMTDNFPHFSQGKITAAQGEPDGRAVHVGGGAGRHNKSQSSQVVAILRTRPVGDDSRDAQGSMVLPEWGDQLNQLNVVCIEKWLNHLQHRTW